MDNNIISGIDIGNQYVKVLIGREDKGSTGNLTLIGSGISNTHGVNKNTILNSKDLSLSISKAIRRAEKAADTKIKYLYVGIGSTNISSVLKTDRTLFPTESIVKDHDIEESVLQVKKSIARDNPNKEIIYIEPIKYSLDDEVYEMSPVGLNVSKKLEIEYFVVLCSTQYINNLLDAIEMSGVLIFSYFPSPIASASVLLSEQQKNSGCALVDIGSKSTSVLVYEDGSPIALKTFPVGSNDITNDIALSLKVQPLKAEAIKTGTSETNGVHTKIIDMQIRKIFTDINNYLKQIGRDGLLPNGVIISGGSTEISKIDDIAVSIFKMPVELAKEIVVGQKIIKNKKLSMHSSGWAVAYGSINYALQQYKETFGLDSMRTLAGNGFKKILSGLKRILS